MNKLNMARHHPSMKQIFSVKNFNSNKQVATAGSSCSSGKNSPRRGAADFQLSEGMERQISRKSMEEKMSRGSEEGKDRPVTTRQDSREKRGWDKKIRESSREISTSSREEDGELIAGIRLSKQTIDEIRDVFMEFDIDGDGTITTKELGTVMMRLNEFPSDEELRVMVAEVDQDKNGTIELDEFLIMMARRIRDSNTIREVFNVFDSNKDGVITADELSKVMEGLGEDLNQEELDEMMRWADRDGDGVVGVSEFSSLMFETVRNYFSSQLENNKDDIKNDSLYSLRTLNS